MSLADRGAEGAGSTSPACTPILNKKMLVHGDDGKGQCKFAKESGAMTFHIKD
jgi:hypothetical protein